MNSIAEDLLTFNKISNSLSGRQEDVVLEELISQVIFEKEQVLKNRARKIDFHFNKESKTRIGHQIELYRIFSNILQNSIEAITAEGVIKIEVTKKKESVTISISDNGEGIPAEILKKIGTQEITTKVSGNGLGLFYAKRTILSLSGQFSINSQRELGTTIVIEIPL
jgi:signal transduction histidine kinase